MSNIKLQLHVGHVDVITRSLAEQPFKLVNETVTEILRQANDQGLQNPAPGPVAYVEGEIRTAYSRMKEFLIPNTIVLGPDGAEALIAALRAGRDVPADPTAR